MSISITNYLKYRVMHHEKQIKDLIQNASEHYQNMRKKMWRKSKILKLHTTIKFLIQNTINYNAVMKHNVLIKNLHQYSQLLITKYILFIHLNS